MKVKILLLFSIFICFIIINSCNLMNSSNEIKIIFLHHSTGKCIWNGDRSSYKFKILNAFNKLIGTPNPQAAIPKLIKEYNQAYQKNIEIEEMEFPKSEPYGWNNYPYDYYTIWVKNSGNNLFMEEPTLEILTKKYNIIMFKHCFPVSKIIPGGKEKDETLQIKTLENYKYIYQELKAKMYQFPQNKFILWTGAALVKSQTTEEEALKAKDFFNWVVNEWDQPDDNIYIWDFYSLQTSGDLYFSVEKAISSNNSHPGEEFSQKAAQNLVNFITNQVIR